MRREARGQGRGHEGYDSRTSRTSLGTGATRTSFSPMHGPRATGSVLVLRAFREECHQCHPVPVGAASIISVVIARGLGSCLGLGPALGNRDRIRVSIIIVTL